MRANIVINHSMDRISADQVGSNIQAMGANVIAVQADAEIEGYLVKQKKLLEK